jgi:putative membrane-bound dehydrogenase-like protein
MSNRESPGRTLRSSKTSVWLWVVAVVLLGLSHGAAVAQGKTEKIPGAPGFNLKPGFRIEMVASEPEVQSPVAMAFDEHGRLFVVERSEQEPEKGRVRLLEDPEGSGKFTVSTLYAEDIPAASAIACYDDGIFVAAGHDILYLKDSRGSRRADVRRVAFSGLTSTANNAEPTQGVFHSFTWGPDNRIYVGSGGLLGSLKIAGTTAETAFSFDRADFSFDPHALTLRREPGPSRSGLAFDNWGREYLCDFDRPLRRVIYPPDYYFERNPYCAPPPGVIDVVSPAITVFPAGSGEPAKTNSAPERTASAGAVTKPNVATRMTKACGLLIYRGTALPTNYLGNAFIADPENHLIHRAVIRERELFAPAERPKDESRSEFLTTTDTSFRPVQLATGPEGALYIVDLNSGANRGRIYRVIPDNFKQPKNPDLGKASTNELATALVSPNAWQRDTAARLIYTGRNPSMLPILSNVVMITRSSLARLQALRSLAGLGGVAENHLLKCLRDPDERVRKVALEYCQAHPFSTNPSENLVNQLRSLAADPSIQVRLQLALTLGEIQRPGRELVLEDLLRRDLTNQWVQGAVLSSLLPNAAPTFARLAGDRRLWNSPAGYRFIKRMADMLGVRGGIQEVGQSIDFLYGTGVYPEQAFELLADIGGGLHRTRSSIALIDPQALNRAAYATALSTATDERAKLASRICSIQLLGVSPFVFRDIGDWLLALINPNETPDLQAAVIGALRPMVDPGVTSGLLQRWQTLRPELRRQAASALLARPERVPSLLAAMESGNVRPVDMTAAQLNCLRTHPIPAVSQRAIRLLGPIVSQRPEVMANFRPALTLAGSAERGRELFAGRCAACHRPSPLTSIGGSLAAAKAKSKEKLLSDIVEPNREVSDKARTVVIETGGGEILIGIVVRETGRSLLLRLENGDEVIFPSTNIQSIQPQGWSIMPEGLEVGLRPQDLADLLKYLYDAPNP